MPVVDKLETAANKTVSCLGWLMLFGIIGIVLMAIVSLLLKDWGVKEELRRDRTLMAEQIELINRGEMNCLIQPDPRFIDDLMSDAACMAKIRDLYICGDLSDPRLSRLLELPNLKCVIVLFGNQSDKFFENLSRNVNIEELSIDHTHLTRETIDCINSLPNLKSLCIPIQGLKSDDLQGISGNPTIEKLYLGNVESYNGLLPILQSLPRLKSVTIQILEERNPESFRESLEIALPECKCQVRGAER